MTILNSAQFVEEVLSRLDALEAKAGIKVAEPDITDRLRENTGSWAVARHRAREAATLIETLRRDNTALVENLARKGDLVALKDRVIAELERTINALMEGKGVEWKITQNS